VGSLLVSVLATLLFHLYFSARAREISAQARATEAQLRLLQAQIEPHFLFNTLANVVSLIDHDAPRAKQMLEAFTDYLRASLGRLRDDDSTLGHELDMAEAYLKLLQTRMDDRLHYRIDADAALRDMTLPPLVLQPLVENAIHHGLEPKIDGGNVQIVARREGNRLSVSVDDDGLGLDAAARTSRRGSNGLALANLRERLAARYGDDGSLALAPRATGGTSATLTIPLAPHTA
jgi:sensor histidine kinase YesM